MTLRVLGLSLVSFAFVAHAEEWNFPTAEPAGKIEVVAAFDGPMPTGVTVSRKGRIFVNFSRWGDKVDFTAAEMRGGKPVA